MTKDCKRFANRLDSDNDDKLSLIDTILKNKCKNVLDLGAGTALLSKEIASKDIHVDAVDINFKASDLIANDFINYYPIDIVSFIMLNANNCNKYDCIIFSAVLHELSPKDFDYIKHHLSKIMDKEGCLLIIREPWYSKKDDYYLPFRSKAEQEKAVNDILLHTPTSLRVEYFDKRKLNETITIFKSELPYEIRVLNLAFAYSYGEWSWPREKKESRYAFSYDKLVKWAKFMFNQKAEFTIESKVYNKKYKDYFKNVGYPEDLTDKIYYTNGLLVIKGKPVRHKIKTLLFNFIQD